MKNEVTTILFEYLAGEGDILNEQAITIQEAEKQFYEILMSGSNLVLADGNRLINRRKRLWGVLKKRVRRTSSWTTSRPSMESGKRTGCFSYCTSVSLWNRNKKTLSFG